MPTVPFIPNPSDAADWSSVEGLQRKMVDAVRSMGEMTSSIGAARQVIEYNGDQRKRCLAIVAFPLIKSGASSAAAETESRASDRYGAALDQLARELTAAEATRAEYENLRLQWETARSLLSLQKESIRNL